MNLVFEGGFLLMVKKHVLTKDGLEKCKQELEELKTIKRKEIAEKIKVAMSFGDLSENSEYDEAKNEQAKIEARIADLEIIIKNANVIDNKKLSTNKIHIGSFVKILNRKNKKIYDYHIVGSNEADPEKGKISDECPVGKALLNHEVGHVVAVDTPNGTVNYEIIEIGK